MATTICEPTKAEELDLFDMFTDSLPEGYLKSIFRELAPSIMRAIRSDLAFLDYDIDHRARCVDDLEERCRKLSAHASELEERARDARRRLANVAKYARDLSGDASTICRTSAELAAMASKGWDDTQ